MKFYGCARILDEFVIVMNYIDGSNLDRVLFGKKKEKVAIMYKIINFYLYTTLQLSDEDKKYIAGEVCKGVQYMHNHMPVIIHQDLKPQNILVNNLIDTS